MPSERDHVCLGDQNWSCPPSLFPVSYTHEPYVDFKVNGDTPQPLFKNLSWYVIDFLQLFPTSSQSILTPLIATWHDLISLGIIFLICFYVVSILALKFCNFFFSFISKDCIYNNISQPRISWMASQGLRIYSQGLESFKLCFPTFLSS